LQKEGVYMFGGVIGKDSSEKFLSNKLFFLPVG
jgi:hypothetical protein